MPPGPVLGGLQPGHRGFSVSLPSSTLTAPAGAFPGDSRDEAREATLGSAIRLGAEAGSRLLGVVTTLFVARSLGPADFGAFAAILGLVSIASEAGDLGLQTTASRALVAGTLSLPSLVRAKLLLTTLLWLAAAPLGFIHPALVPLVLWVSLGRWCEFLGAALRARGRRSDEAAVLVCLRAAGLGAALLAVTAGGGLVALAWLLAISSLAALALGAFLLARSRDPLASNRDMSADVAGALQASLPVGVNGVLALLSVRVELLALALFRSDREAGVFAAALKVVEFLVLVPAAIAAGAMPALTREAALGGGRARRRTAASAAFLGVPAALGLVLVAPGLVPRVFGPEFAGSAAPLQVLALALAPMFMNGVLLHSLIAAGHARVLPRLTALRVALAMACAAFLVPAFGAGGGAAGFVASELLLLVLAARACASRGMRVPVLGLLLSAAGVSVPMAAALLLAQRRPVEAAILGLATYAATLAIALRLSPRFRRFSTGAEVGYP
jgi:O-antigen/teichoic acid export membrane protein